MARKAKGTRKRTTARAKSRPQNRRKQEKRRGSPPRPFGPLVEQVLARLGEKLPGGAGGEREPGRPKAQRNADGTFIRGQSGNPGGRPVEYKAFVELAREVGSPAAFEALIWEIENGDFGPARVKAAEILLAYAWGRPKQAVELTGKDGGPVETTDARSKLAQLLLGRLEAMERKGGGGGGGEGGGAPAAPVAG